MTKRVRICSLRMAVGRKGNHGLARSERGSRHACYFAPISRGRLRRPQPPVEGPEYAAIPKLPGGHNARLSKDTPVACGVRIKSRWRDGSRTTHDDWVVWVTSDHKAVDWSGNKGGDKWRPYVRSFAKK